jgi:hypothetical protein
VICGSCHVETEMGTEWSPFFLLACRDGFGAYPWRFDHPIRPDTTGANTNALGFPIHDGSHALQIGKPTSLGSVVGMTDIVASSGSLATNLTNAGHMRATLKLNFGYEKLTTQQATQARPFLQGLVLR